MEMSWKRVFNFLKNFTCIHLLSDQCSECVSNDFVSVLSGKGSWEDTLQ
jgi:hypothetical protein